MLPRKEIPSTIEIDRGFVGAATAPGTVQDRVLLGADSTALASTALTCQQVVLPSARPLWVCVRVVTGSGIPGRKVEAPGQGAWTYTLKPVARGLPCV